MHVLKADQSLTAQLVHDCVSVNSDSDGHSVPPFAAGVVIVLVRVFNPVLLHVLKADQPLTAQLTAGAHAPPVHAVVRLK